MTCYCRMCQVRLREAEALGAEWAAEALEQIRTSIRAIEPLRAAIDKARRAEGDGE